METRHNAGTWFVKHLADQAGIKLTPQKQYHGLYAKGVIANQSCHLLIPTTFMNHSGQAVAALCHYYQIMPQATMVAHDELDLIPGDIRLKYDGGHGGHNGLRDIIAHLHSAAFNRLRIGIGHPGHSKDVTNYVLRPPKRDERQAIDTAIHRVEAILPLLLQGQLQKAMHQLHTKP